MVVGDTEAPKCDWFATRNPQVFVLAGARPIRSISHPAVD